LKSGGYKISALDIEREILALDYIAEVAVMGVEDEEFGDRVAAAIVLKDTVSWRGSVAFSRLIKLGERLFDTNQTPRGFAFNIGGLQDADRSSCGTRASKDGVREGPEEGDQTGTFPV
jgi:hypothetical protein